MRSLAIRIVIKTIGASSFTVLVGKPSADWRHCLIMGQVWGMSDSPVVSLTGAMLTTHAISRRVCTLLAGRLAKIIRCVVISRCLNARLRNGRILASLRAPN